MKKTIKSNWLIIVLMALVVCFTAVGVATLRFERGTTVDTLVFANAVYDDPTVGGEELTTLKYDSGLQGADDETLTITSKFYLEKGASVRVNKETSGLRFTVRYGDVLDSALKQDGVPGKEAEQVADNYSIEYYNYQLYMIFQKAGTKSDGTEYSKTWVPITLYDFWNITALEKEGLTADYVDRTQGVADWDMYQVFSAALNFGNLTKDQLDIAKTWEIKASAVVVITGKPETDKADEKVFFYAGENDNTRSMQAVANAAIQAGEDPEFINQLEGKPFVDQSLVVNFKDDTLLESSAVDGEGNVSATVEGLSEIQGVSGIYFGAKKLSTATLSDNTFTLNTSELESVTKGDRLPLAIFTTDGKTYNAPFKYVDKVITTADEMHQIFNIDDGDANTTNPRLVEGYYILGNDIVGTQTYEYKHADMATVWNDTTSGFKGTFDGNGHYVTLDITTNGGSSKSGIFGQIQSGAVIKNVAFVDCTMNQGVFLFSGIMNNDSATIENVYLNFKATGSATYGGSAWYATTKLVVKGVFIDNDTAASNISNGKTTAQLLAGDISTNGNHGHGAYVSNETTSSASNLNGLIIVTEAPLGYKRPSETTHSMVVGGNTYYADGTKVEQGDTIACPCGDGTVMTINVFNNIYQYASIDELTGYVNGEGEQVAGRLSEISGILENYSAEYWDFSYGYPRFKSVVEKDRVEGVVADAKFYVSGSETTETIHLENAGENTSVFLYAEYSGMSFYPQLNVVTGTDFVSVDNVAGTISAKAGVTGSATVTATYVIAGVEFVKEYSVLVTLPLLNAEFRYSTNDDKLFVSNGFDLYSVDRIVDATDGTTEYYNDGVVSNMIANTDQSDLTNLTKPVTVYMDNGDTYSSNLVFYTQVIDEDDDFTVFNQASTSATLYGYYIVNNDIILDSFTGNLHGNNYGTSGVFHGTLDGDGHTVEIALGRQGLFGNTAAPSCVKDIAFLVKQINSTGSMNATMFGFNGNLDVENVYVKYESTVTFDIGYNSWGQGSGLGLFFYSTADNLSNVVFDISEANITCSKESPFRYGSLFSMYNGTSNSGDNWNLQVENFILYSKLPYFAYMAGTATSGGTSTSVNNTYPTYVAFAGNQKAEYDAYVLANDAKETEKAEQVRYMRDSLMFADEQALASSGTDVSAFANEIWDTSKGYPEFRGLSNVETRKDIVNNTEFYLGGVENATHADLDTEIVTSTSVNATYADKTYLPVYMEVVDGTAVVVDTATGTISTVGEEGDATINVYYNVEGVEFAKTYTAKVTLPKFDGKIMFSVVDNEFILPDGLTLDEIDDLSSVDGCWLGGGGELYGDELLAIVEENAASSVVNPERFSLECIIYIAGVESPYYINVESYTKVIMTEEDLACLVDDEATTDAPITGYYVLGANITHGTWEGNTSSTSYFAGTFDGDGHYVELKLNSVGLFSGIKGATIKNTAFIVNEKGTARYILAKTATANNYYIQDVYIDVNVQYSATTNFSIIGVNSGAYMKYSNSIIDFAPGTLVFDTGAWRYGGLFEDYTSSAWFLTQDTDYDGDSVNDNRFNYSAFTNTYYINSDFKYAGFYVGGTAGTLNALYFAENDGALYASVKDTITASKFGFYKGLKRYDDFTAMGTAGNDYSAFNADVWYFTEGYPRFKSIVDEENIASIEANTEFYLGGSKDATEANLSVDTENASVDVYATYKGTTYYPTLEITYGPNFVEIDENGYTVNALRDGTATVKASYVIDDAELGVKFVTDKTYSITVSMPKLEGQIWFSTSDGKLYFPNGIELEDVVYLTDTIEYSEVIVEGEILDTSLLPQNNDGTDLANYTIDCEIELSDGSYSLIELVSYTKVLTTDDDFTVLQGANGTSVTGYYIMANDIMLDSWVGNTCSDSSPHVFTGVFDGNGHMAEIALKKYGVFGTTNGATIKNVAFIVKQIGAKNFAHASILAYAMTNTTVSNSYFEYDLPAGTTVDAGYYGWGQSSGIGLYATGKVGSTFNNVVFDSSKLEMINTDVESAFAYGAIMAKADGSSGTAYVPKGSDIYTITTNKYMGYYASVTTSGNSITAFNGIKYAFFASNDTDAYEACTVTGSKYTVAGAKRYDNVTAFAEDAENNDYTTFDSKIWSTSNGYPEFIRVVEYKRLQNINTNTEFYLGGSTESNEASLELGTENGSIEVYASLDSQTYIPEIVVDGEAVTAVNGVVTAVALGSATITATYDVDGVQFVKTYTITVTAPVLKAELRYSTLTNELFVEDNEFELSTVETIVDSTDSTVYYENDAVTSSIVKNYTVEDLATVTKDVYVVIGGVQYSGKLVSYTQVINEDTDFVIFKEANHATQSVEGHAYASAYEIVSSQPILRGYYIVNNDIRLSGDWDGNYHEYNNKAASFGGTFDGDGHVVELKLYSGGLFGSLYGATVKDVALVAKDLYADTVTTGRYAFLANQTWSVPSDYTIIDNVYAKYDLDVAVQSKYQSWSRYSGISFVSNNGYYIKYTNSILDATSLEITDVDDLGNYGFTSSAFSSTFETNGFRSSTTNNYFITSLPYVAHALGVSSNAYTGTFSIGYGANQTAEYEADTTSAYKYQYAGISLYANYEAMATAGNDYSSYNTEVWTIEEGKAPVFTAYAEYVEANAILAGTKLYLASVEGQTTADITIGEEISAYAIYNEETYNPTLAVTAGNAVTVEGNVITAVIDGEATVTATYDIEGVEIVVTYTVNVSIPTYDGKVLYSTLDNKVYTPDFKEGAVTSIVDVDDETVYFDGTDYANIPTNETSTVVTKNALVTLEGGMKYYISLDSYTKVLTTAQDFTIFNIETETTILSGSYALGNDITTKEEVFFTHHGLHAADATNNLTDTTVYNYTGAGFAGTFDGLGHAVTMNVKGAYGIFGQFLAGAKVQNVAFYDMTIGLYRDDYARNAAGELISKAGAGQDRWNTLLARGAQNNARTVYVTDVFAEITEISSKGTWGSGFISSPGYINMTGVMVKFTPTIGNLHGAITGYTVASNSYTNGLIAITDQALASNTGWKWIGSNEGYANGDVVEDITYKVIANAYRYPDYASLAADTANHETLYQHYSTEYWDFTSGYPVFKSILNIQNAETIASQTEFYLGGSSDATSTDIYNTGDNTSVSAYAVYGGENYYPTLKVVSGNTVTVSGSTITAAPLAEGESVVSATYDIANAKITVSYVINVSFPEYTAETIKYSTLDNQVFLPFDFDGKEIASIVNTDDATVYYADGLATENVPKNTESSDLTDYTKNITITFDDNTGYKTTLTSYTKVITKDTDLSDLVDTTGTSEQMAIVDGYYILANDIEYSGEFTGNNAAYSYFAGTLDGDGHYVDLYVGARSLLNGMYNGAEVKNIAFLVNNKAASSTSYVLASTSYQMWGGRTYNITDVYCEINVELAGGTAKFCEENLSSGARYNNFVLKLKDGVQQVVETGYTRGGAIWGYTTNSSVIASTVDGFNYVNSTGASDSKNNSSFKNSYYINSDYKFTARWIEGGAKKNVIVAENDAELYALATKSTEEGGYGYENVGYISGVKRYDNFTAMASANNDYSTFNTDVWDISLGYPVWKGIKISDNSVLLVNGEAGNSASIASGYTDSVTIDVEVDSQTVPTMLSVLDGAELVRIDGNVVYADSNVPGTAIILVKANVNGHVVYKQVAIELTVTDMTAKTVMYSTLDNEMFFNDFNKEITKIALFEDETVIYENGVATVDATLQNNDSEDLTDYTKEVIVTFSDDTLAKTTLVSYTKVINEDDDFAVFESKTGETKAGYYIMINDIELDGSWTGNASESGGGARVSFTGIFDGQGHVAEIALNHYGIFGSTTGATIKNAAFIVKSIGAKTFAYASILAYKMQTTTVSDCYFKYDLPEDTAIDVSYYGYGQSSGLGLYAAAGNNNKFNNVVIDTTSVETTCVSNTQPYAYGSIMSKAQLNSSGVGGGTWQPVTSNVYVLSADKYLAYIASVTASGNTISAFNGIGTALFASNDTTAYNDCIANNKAVISGSYRYDNMASALTAGETFSGLTASESGLWTLDANGELMFGGIALGSVEVNTFISNGVSEYAIVVPTSLNLTGTSNLAYAVNDLHDYVNLATNGSVDLPIVKASEFNANTYPKYLSVGNTGLMTADVTNVTETLGEDGVFYFSEGDDIYFTGSTNYGIANGVYDFLRTYFGFDAITDDVVVYNENVTDVSFTSLYKVDVPDVPQRHINGVNAQTRARYSARSGYMGYNIGGLYNASFTAYEIPGMHNTLDYIPYSIHSAEHGTYWYATDENNVIIGGSTPKDICYTAHGDATQYQAMVDQFVSRIQDTFRQRDRLKALQSGGGYSWANSTWDTLVIMTEDNGTACNCTACQETKALYGGFNSGALIKFVNDVKTSIDAWFETPTGSTYKIDDFKIMFSAYQKFIDAPVVFNETTGKYVPVHEDVVPAEGVVLQIATSESSGLSPYFSINAAENAQGKATIEKWATLVDGINLWTYQANFSNYLYFGDTFELFNEEGYTFFDNNKVNAWVNQNSNAKQTSWAALKEYSSSKLMWDTNADLEEIYDNYFDAVYGTASVAMRNLFDMQREAFQDALASYAAANPELSVAGYSNIFNGYYDDDKLATIIDGYRAALASVEENSYAYYQIIKEAISPYFIALTNHNRQGALGTYASPSAYYVTMDSEEIARIQTLKVEFKQMLEAYEAVYGPMNRTEHVADLSSDIVFNQLGYIFRPSNNPISLIIFNIDGSRVGTSTRTITTGVHDIGWFYGYPDGKGGGSMDFRNVTIEVLSGDSVASITLGVDQAGNELKWNSKTYVDENGCLPATDALSARFQLGVLNCSQAGTAVLRLHYDLDGMHYTYDLTLTVTAE